MPTALEAIRQRAALNRQNRAPNFADDVCKMYGVW